MWSRRARERKAAHALFSTIADRIDARSGQLLKETFHSGLLIAPQLAIITVRPGPAAEVAQAQLEAAVAAGYTEPPQAPCDSQHPCIFITPQELPQLRIETFPAGAALRATDFTVPSNFTAVLIGIG